MERGSIVCDLPPATRGAVGIKGMSAQPIVAPSRGHGGLDGAGGGDFRRHHQTVTNCFGLTVMSGSSRWDGRRASWKTVLAATWPLASSPNRPPVFRLRSKRGK